MTPLIAVVILACAGGASPDRVEYMLLQPIRYQFIQALLSCQQLQTESGRQRVIQDLPTELQNSISYSSIPTVHVANIVDRCVQIPGGLRSLMDFLAFYEGATRNLIRTIKIVVLLDLFEIINAEVGEKQLGSVMRMNLPESVQLSGEEELWSVLSKSWNSQESPHPIFFLIDNLSNELPLSRTELIALRNWLVAHPQLDIEAKFLHTSTAPQGIQDKSTGDLVLSVHRTDDRTLAFSLHSPSGSLPYDHVDMGVVRLQNLTGLRIRIDTLVHRLSMYTGKPVRSLSENEVSEAIRQIENIGIDLFDVLFPSRLKEEYPALLEHRDVLEQQQNRRLILMVSSDESWIPWELVRSHVHRGDFLAADFALIRHLPGTNPGKHLTIRTCQLVQPSLDLSMVVQEHNTLFSLADGRFELAEPITTIHDFLAHCHRGGAQLLHVATHGEFAEEEIPLSPIHLEDGIVILQDLNRLRAPGLIDDKPFVFLNACHSSRLGLDLAGPDGWAKRFMLDFKVTGFIGSQWAIHDELATVFSQAFYEQMALGSTLAQSVYLARQKTREVQPANPTWLAYSCYGNPQCVFHFDPTS